MTREFHLKLRREKTAPTGIDPLDLVSGYERRPYRKICLSPCLNLESLSKNPATFLNLLYNRVMYSSESWAPHDNHVIKGHWELRAFETEYNPGYIILFGEKYGQLTTSQRRELHDWTLVGFPRGILIPEAQYNILKVLRGVVEKLLHGLDTDDREVHAHDFTSVLDLGLRSGAGSSAVEFASSYLDQSYSAPPVFDIYALCSVAESMKGMHGDHIWLLQTDPAYTRRYAALLQKGALGEKLSKQNQYVHLAIGMMEDCTEFWSWEWILEESQKLRVIYTELQDDIRAGKPLPKTYEAALSSLEALLREMLKNRCEHTYGALTSRPGFSSSWKHKSLERLQSSIIIPERANPEIITPILFLKDRLDYCLWMLVIGTKDQLGWKIFADGTPKQDQSTLFAMLDEQLTECQTTKKGEIARLDEILYMKYSDLSAIHQMLTILRLHRPGFMKREFKVVKKTSKGRCWTYINKHFLDQSPMLKVATNPDGTYKFTNDRKMKEDADTKTEAQQRLAGYLKEFLATPKPSGSRLNPTWIAKDDAQRSALSRFWDQMRGRHRQTLIRLGIEHDDIEKDLVALSADSEPEHISKVQATRDRINSKPFLTLHSVTSREPSSWSMS